MISVIIPVHNAEKFIEETVDSVRRQTYREWELLLIENGSGDRSLEVCNRLAEEDRRIRVLKCKGRGAAAARNTGTVSAIGRYQCFLDADDIWKEDKLEKELAFCRKKDAAFVFTGYEFADENAKGTGKIVRVPETISYEEALGNTTIFTSTVMFDRKKLPLKLMLMPKVASEDTATWWQILRSGYTGYGLDEPLTLYRRSARTLSSNKLEALRRTWNLYRKVEGFGVFKSLRYFVKYAVRAVLRRL